MKIFLSGIIGLLFGAISSIVYTIFLALCLNQLRVAIHLFCGKLAVLRCFNPFHAYFFFNRNLYFHKCRSNQ